MGEFKQYPALRISQPFGDFYVVSMKAKDLLQISFSDALRYDETGKLRGSQRKLDLEKRVKSITNYINGDDTAFPNSIILSANYTEKGLIEDDEEIRWSVEETKDDTFVLHIPSTIKLAAIIDGQHRLNGFEKATEERKEMDLLVAVYFDLPNPYQAYLFAKINYHQKSVDRSLALEQFGFLTEEYPAEKWSPELLAVYLSKKLNTDLDSPFYNHIKVAPQNDQYLLKHNPKDMDWLVSTSTVVDGILKLISSNPKEDNNKLRILDEQERLRYNIERNDNSPLRTFYLEKNDIFIHKAVSNFFTASRNIYFENSEKGSFIKKTVGIQALFDILKEILAERLSQDKDISVSYFENWLIKANRIDFTDSFFNASGSGKSYIRNAILIAMEFKALGDVRSKEEEYKRILQNADII